MGKHNYSQYSNKNTTPAAEPEVAETEVILENTAPEIEVVEEAVATPEVKMEPQPATKTVTGKVANCTKLNVRANPSTTADVVCVLDVASEVTIDKKQSTKDWFKVVTNTGIEGYCMRKFVEASL